MYTPPVLNLDVDSQSVSIVSMFMSVLKSSSYMHSIEGQYVSCTFCNIK